jgi:hypothetical protein
VTLLPYERITLESSHSADELVGTLKSMTRAPKWELRLTPGPTDTAEFLGEVSKDRLSICLASPARNSFKPFVEGKIVPAASGARIEAVMHPHTIVLLFMAFFALALLPPSVIAAGEAIQKGSFRGLVWQPLVMLAGLYPVCMLGYLPAARRMKQRLRELTMP